MPSKLDLPPRFAVLVMRPHENAAVPQHRMPALAQVLAPSGRRTAAPAGSPRAGTNRHRARSADRAAGRRARRTPRAWSTAARSNQSSNTCEPVTTMRSRVEVVELDGLALLDLVPDDDLLRREVELALARQVIPAGHREHVADAELHRGARQVELRRLEHDERRQHDDVGAVLAEILVEDRRAARRLLEHVERCAASRQRPGAPSASAMRTAGRGARLRARASSAGACPVGGVEESQVEARPAEAGRQLPPAGLRRASASCRSRMPGQLFARASTNGGQSKSPRASRTSSMSCPRAARARSTDS